MFCIKCNQKANKTIKVNILNIDKIYSCDNCFHEINRDFNLVKVHDDSGDFLFIRNILNKYKLYDRNLS